MEKKGIVSEFKEFISRGNVMDMAVGIIIGGAFTAIVQSLVNDLLMPVIGALFGGVDFSTLSVELKAATETSEAVLLKYGSFIQAIVNFLLIAIVIFPLVRGINKMRRKKEEPAPAPAPDPEPSEEVKLLTEIRDALKK